ncbi:Carnitine O-acetyltransferase mitochondrial [Coemansia sp. RSA 1286]|nr:Carnitine O-acetyltransferase mitochondrial [Coemansia sp. RSA 485]KAJ2601788.1 Carnitine O-acetyltransferase mitochondrial [Coemansia sp. RSA 1721]KAJ2639078.1 Carnitine O-acetyltransferase mitochondrial [Coemansia sp. RSA 1286]
MSPTSHPNYSTSSLSKLPIPELEDTVSRFKAAARPLFEEEEFEKCMAKFEHFVATEAPVLQARLKERADAHENWLEEWWNEYAYFLNRSSLCFNVNYFFGFRHTPHPLSQARLAAILIDSTLRFRDTLESGELEHDNIRGKAMCMHQYQYMFATCRHPGETRDHTEIYARDQSRHVAIAHKGRFFALRVPDTASTDRLAAIQQIEVQLQAIIDSTEQLERAKSIGILTASLRDDWYAARECLLQVSPGNAESLRILESSAFLVSLESVSPSTHQEFSLACHCSNGVDRYFDKNFQLLVFANGRYGFNGEHSLTDATTDMRLCNALVKDVEALCSEVAPAALSTAAVSDSQCAVSELAFDYNAELLGHIQRAVDYFDTTVRGHELATLEFDSFGKEQIKKMKVSPDAFVQMAMQLAYYRKFGHVPATYESASTKSYARGRTETSRSVSEHSVQWCRMMVDNPETTSLHTKSELLKQAIINQSQFTAQCAKGAGIDRHLLGLEYALLSDEAKPEIFSDPVFLASRHWKLSTSQISDPILGAYGWGEVVDDGFGVAYRIENNSLHFNVVSQRLGSKRLCRYLSDALMDMRFLLTNAHKQPHEIMAEVDAVANVLNSIKLLSSVPRSPASPTFSSESSAHEDTSSESARFRDPFPSDPAASNSVLDELERLPSSEMICALETRLSRFVKESLYWALPSTS